MQNNNLPLDRIIVNYLKANNLPESKADDLIDLIEAAHIKAYEYGVPIASFFMIGDIKINFLVTLEGSIALELVNRIRGDNYTLN